MPGTETYEDIEEDEVCVAVKQGLRRDMVHEVCVKRQDNGKFTITLYFKNS